jgi:hypothetical protein
MLSRASFILLGVYRGAIIREKVSFINENTPRAPTGLSNLYLMVHVSPIATAIGQTILLEFWNGVFWPVYHRRLLDHAYNNSFSPWLLRRI